MEAEEIKVLMEQWHSDVYIVSAYRSFGYCAVNVYDRATGKHAVCSKYETALENFEEALKMLKRGASEIPLHSQ